MGFEPIQHFAHKNSLVVSGADIRNRIAVWQGGIECGVQFLPHDTVGLEPARAVLNLDYLGFCG
jgi:hypothetical protein